MKLPMSTLQSVLSEHKKITEDEVVTNCCGRVEGNEKKVTEGTRCRRISKCVNTALSQEDNKKIRNERTIGRI